MLVTNANCIYRNKSSDTKNKINIKVAEKINIIKDFKLSIHNKEETKLQPLIQDY